MTREEAIKQLLKERFSIFCDICECKATCGGKCEPIEAYDMAIEALPEPKTGWIPVSERLPDIGDTYLVTVMVGTDIRTDVASSFGSYIDGFWDTFNDWVEDKECHVIAWMPLPEPYREDGEA